MEQDYFDAKNESDRESTGEDSEGNTVYNWFTLIHQLAKEDYTKWDVITSLPLFRFLFIISFEKEKNYERLQQIRDNRV